MALSFSLSSDKMLNSFSRPSLGHEDSYKTLRLSLWNAQVSVDLTGLGAARTKKIQRRVKTQQMFRKHIKDISNTSNSKKGIRRSMYCLLTASIN